MPPTPSLPSCCDLLYSHYVTHPLYMTFWAVLSCMVFDNCRDIPLLPEGGDKPASPSKSPLPFLLLTYLPVKRKKVVLCLLYLFFSLLLCALVYRHTAFAAIYTYIIYLWAYKRRRRRPGEQHLRMEERELCLPGEVVAFLLLSPARAIFRMAARGKWRKLRVLAAKQRTFGIVLPG